MFELDELDELQAGSGGRDDEVEREREKPVVGCGCREIERKMSELELELELVLGPARGWSLPLLHSDAPCFVRTPCLRFPSCFRVDVDLFPHDLSWQTNCSPTKLECDL